MPGAVSLSSASLLPLVSQSLAQTKAGVEPAVHGGTDRRPRKSSSRRWPWIGYWSELWGRKPFLLMGFATEALRGLLFAFTTDPSLMIVIQLLLLPESKPAKYLD